MLERAQPKYTERIIQFGTGNFLRGFFDWQIDLLNETGDLDTGIVVLKSTDSKKPSLNLQDGLYTVVTRGLDDEGEVIEEARLITSVNRQLEINQDYEAFLELAHNLNLRTIVSNTTEAGIVYDSGATVEGNLLQTFPANLTQLLFERYKKTEGDAEAGFCILPCELIDDNGAKLKEIVMRHTDDWNLGEGFKRWLEHANTFYSTLVDRIVTGYPEDAESLQAKLGYDDVFMTVAEPFYFFAIQGPKEPLALLKIETLPNVIITDDIAPYKQRKVGLLNAAHTSLVPVAYLAGIDTVREAVEDEVVGSYLSKLLEEELIPSLDLPKDELEAFAKSVVRRFKNPFIEHKLLDISLNSISKVVARLLPRLQQYREKFGELPKRLVFALAVQLYFYRAKRNGAAFALKDEGAVLTILDKTWSAFESGRLTLPEVAQNLLQASELWQQDLTQIEGVSNLVQSYLEAIHQHGIREATAQL